MILALEFSKSGITTCYKNGLISYDWWNYREEQDFNEIDETDRDGEPKDTSSWTDLLLEGLL